MNLKYLHWKIAIKSSIILKKIFLTHKSKCFLHINKFYTLVRKSPILGYEHMVRPYIASEIQMTCKHVRNTIDILPTKANVSLCLPVSHIIANI